jgi:DNA-binding beta-propeller fold protein YncE
MRTQELVTPPALRRAAVTLLLAGLAGSAFAAGPLDAASLVWTQKHATAPAGFTSEAVSFDSLSKTLWVAGVNGVAVLDAKTGSALDFIGLPRGTAINSVAIHGGVAALALESTVDRKLPGQVLLYGTASRSLLAGTSSIAVGALPDMLTFTPDGKKLLVANEGTPNSVPDQAYSFPDPKGSVSIIDMGSRSVVATATFDTVVATASNRVFPGQALVRAPGGFDAEPEYIAISPKGDRAFVTLQEANAVGVIDLNTNTTVKVIGLGAKDFGAAGNEIDPRDGGGISFQSYTNVRGLYQPDGIASFHKNGKTYFVTANEGDFQEDNADRSNASAFGAAGDLANLRVSNFDSSAGVLYTAGARSISIRDENGDEVWDSGSALDREAAKLGLYADGRSREKGTEPEDVKLLDIAGRLYAFVGLERTTRGAVAVFDITDPSNGSFVRMLLTDTTETRPEVMHAFQMDGMYYLAVANEGSNASTFGTSLFALAPVPEPGTWALMAGGLGLVAWQAQRRRRGSSASVGSRP